MNTITSYAKSEEMVTAEFYLEKKVADVSGTFNSVLDYAKMCYATGFFDTMHIMARDDMRPRIIRGAALAVMCSE